MSCRSKTISLIHLFLGVLLLLSPTLSRATGSDRLLPFYETDASRVDMYATVNPLDMGDDKGSSTHTNKLDADFTAVNEKTAQTEILVPDGIDEEKAGFIRWILPQIEQAREEIGHLVTTSIPSSLIVAQAALESGWGTSFGAKNRQNLFGLTKLDGQYMSFSSPLDGLKRYILTLDQHRAYRNFRAQLGKTTNSLELTKHLSNYCDCKEYSDKLNRIIRKNKLSELDR